MRKLILFTLMVLCCSCMHENPNGETARFIAVTIEGDSIEVDAKSWEWAEGSVYFHSDDGDQFVRGVKHVILKK